jgi:hypothetical protein
MRTHRHRALIRLVFAAALAAVAAPSTAYDTIGNGSASKWGDNPSPGSGAIVTWGYVPDGTLSSETAEGVDGTSNLSQIRDLINTNHGAGAFEAAIERAFATWSAVANITFVGPVTDPGNPLGATGASTPMIRIGAFALDEEFWGVPGAIGIGPPGFGGHENFPYSGDVVFNLNRTAQIAPFHIATGTEDVTPVDSFQYGDDLEGLFLHELGHAAIGLNHPRWAGENPDTRVMYVGDWLDENAPFCCQAINHKLHPDDIAAAQYVYGLRGDFNRDGAVDAADYTVWRDSLGAEVTSGTLADGNVDGVVDADDYEVWRSHVGDVRLNGFGEQEPFFARSVPEPASLVIAFVCSAFVLAERALDRVKMASTAKARRFSECPTIYFA